MPQPTDPTAPADPIRPAPSADRAAAIDPSAPVVPSAPVDPTAHAPRLALAGDSVLLITADHKRFLERLKAGATLSTHRGIVRHDDLIGQPLGRTIHSHNGHPFRALRPSMEEILVSTQRETQIVYPKDIGYILLKLSVIPGARVVEAGSGSGALTTALARYVAPGGRVYTYEQRPEMAALTARNLERAGVEGAVVQHARAIGDGFDETNVDALFLDVREPWLHLDQAARAMADGAFFGAILPTVNQVIDLVHALRRPDFIDTEVVEIILRTYRPVAARLRPDDHLAAHTGYLVFARKVEPQPDAAPTDAALPDAAPVDDVPPDAAPPDAIPTDAVSADAGPTGDAQAHTAERGAAQGDPPP